MRMFEKSVIIYQLIGMEAGGGSPAEITSRMREWWSQRAPPQDDIDTLREALARATDSATTATHKYEKVRSYVSIHLVRSD